MSHTVIVLSNPNLMRSLSLHEIAKLTQRERTKSLKSAVKIWILSLQCSYWINFSSPVFTSLIHVRKAFLSHTFFNVYVCMSPDSSSQVRNSDMFVWKQLETSGKHLEPGVWSKVVAMAEGCLLDPQRLVLLSLLVTAIRILTQFDQTPGNLSLTKQMKLKCQERKLAERGCIDLGIPINSTVEMAIQS
ncbi:hypothetical protein YC2023_106671 [Brassica napus]